MLHSKFTNKIIGAFYEVYNERGSGFLESVYQNAMVILLDEQGIKCETERPIQVKFRGHVVGEFRPDIFVGDLVIVELKACKAINDKHAAQTLNYMKATGIEVGLLMNFEPNAKFKRLVLDV